MIKLGGIKKLTVAHRELERNDILSIAEGEGEERGGWRGKKTRTKGRQRELEREREGGREGGERDE